MCIPACGNIGVGPRLNATVSLPPPGSPPTRVPKLLATLRNGDPWCTSEHDRLVADLCSPQQDLHTNRPALGRHAALELAPFDVRLPFSRAEIHVEGEAIRGVFHARPRSRASRKSETLSSGIETEAPLTRISMSPNAVMFFGMCPLSARCPTPVGES